MWSLIKTGLASKLTSILSIMLLVVASYALYANIHTRFLDKEISTKDAQIQTASVELQYSQSSVKDLEAQIVSLNAQIQALHDASVKAMAEQQKALDLANAKSAKYQQDIVSLTAYKYTGDTCKDVHNLLSDFGN